MGYFNLYKRTIFYLLEEGGGVGKLREKLIIYLVEKNQIFLFKRKNLLALNLRKKTYPYHPYHFTKKLNGLLHAPIKLYLNVAINLFFGF